MPRQRQPASTEDVTHAEIEGGRGNAEPDDTNRHPGNGWQALETRDDRSDPGFHQLDPAHGQTERRTDPDGDQESERTTPDAVTDALPQDPALLQTPQAVP